MVGDAKVVWSEGMFLQPQHFQQHDRYVQGLARTGLSVARRFPWGVLEYELDQGALALRRLALARVSGIFPDGTPFDAPGTSPLPPALPLPESLRDETVYLTLPASRPGQVDTDRGGARAVTRYAAELARLPDSTEADAPEAEVELARLRLSLVPGSGDRGGRVEMPIARVLECAPGQPVRLDPAFIPPALAGRRSSPVLGAYLDEMLGLLRQRGSLLASRLTAAAVRGTPDDANFFMLQAINRWEPLVAYLCGPGDPPPEELYALAVQVAGELSTFLPARRPPEFPPYRHDALALVLPPVMAVIREALQAVVDQSVVEIPLQRNDELRLFAGAIHDRSLVTGRAAFYLAVAGQEPREALLRDFPGRVRLGPAARIQDLVYSATRGIPLVPQAAAPPRLPYAADFAYFLVDRGHPLWAGLAEPGGNALAIHLDHVTPGLRLQCWAVREASR